MNKSEFKELYYSHQLKELVELLDCSVPTIYKRLEEYNIPKKGQGKGKREKKKLILED